MKLRALQIAALVLFAQSLLSMCVGSTSNEATAPIYSEGFDHPCGEQRLPCDWLSSGEGAAIAPGLFEEENSLRLPPTESVRFAPADAGPAQSLSAELTSVMPIYCERGATISITVELSAEEDAGTTTVTYQGLSTIESRRWQQSAIALRANELRAGSYVLRSIRLTNTSEAVCWIGSLSLYDNWANPDAPDGC